MTGEGLGGAGEAPLAVVGEAPPVTGGEAPLAVVGEVSLAVAAKASGENFPVALRVLPSGLRRHLVAYYGFARLTDDLGDEPLPGITGVVSAQDEQRSRLRLLDDLEADVATIYEPGGTPELPAIQELGATVKATGIPLQLLKDLIQANRQDQLVTRYDTVDDLVRYCELSANPVGRVVLYIVGAATPERMELSDKVCTALQLVEHWQDVAEDLRNGRVYLPQEDLKQYGVTEDDLAQPTAGAKVRDLLTFEVTRAAELLDQGAPLVGSLHGFARVAIAGYVAGGRAALKAIRDAGYDVLKTTPKPGKVATLAGLASCYARGR